MEKEQPAENVRSLSHSSDRDSEKQQAQDDLKWRPGFKARFPWVGFGALITILLCCASSIIVLEVANNKSKSRWPEKAPPNVLLSTMASISSVCFAVAISNGITIAWWRKTLKGATITDLHNSWASATNIKQLLLGLRYFEIIAIAALVAKICFVDSILMQKALTTYLAYNPAVNQNFTGFVDQTFPITGTVHPGSEEPGVMMHWTGDTFKLWSQKGGTYPNQWTGCEGLCYLDVQGIGFAFDCDSPVSTTVDYGQSLREALQAGNSEAEENLFTINFDAVYSDGSTVVLGRKSSYLTMNVSYTQEDETRQQAGVCPGKRHEQSCRLWPAIINYPVQILNSSDRSSVSVGPMLLKYPHNGTVNEEALQNIGSYNLSGQQQDRFEVVRYIPILESHSSTTAGSLYSNLSGIQLGLEMYLRSRSMLTWNASGEGHFNINQMGHASNFMTDPPSDPQSCSFTYDNPLEAYFAPNGLFQLPSIIGKINQFMFGLTTDISQDNPSSGNYDGGDRGLTTYTGTVHKESIHYLVHFAYMWGAMAATIACVLLVLPVYWGFWELGRPVTLNPFEIAQAFRSPVMAQASTAETTDMLREVGNQEIRYGPIVSGDGSGRFGVAEPRNVAQAAGARSSWRTS